MSRKSERLWDEVHGCFDTDDGSLPGIYISNLSAEGVARIYAMLRSRSSFAGESPPEFWSYTDNVSLPVDSVPNPAALVVSGHAAPFHHCIEGLVAAGVKLPVLGVFVFQDAVELDYRMGRDWGPAEIVGFFELLRDCCAIDPTAEVVPAEREGPPYPERFGQAWEAYHKCEID